MSDPVETYSYTVESPASQVTSDDGTVVQAEIEALEARLVVLYAARARGPRLDYPRWLYKPLPKEPHIKTHPHEKILVNSLVEEQALGEGWTSSPNPDAETDADAGKV